MSPYENTNPEADIKASLETGALPMSFKPSTSPEEYIENTTARLRGLQKFIHDVEVSKIRKDHVIKIARQMFDFHYQDMQHVMLLGMDIAKKARFRQYMEAVSQLGDAIQLQSGDAQISIIGNMVDQLFKADIERNKKNKLLESKIKSGELTQAQGAAHREIYDEFYDKIRGELRNTADLMTKQHLEFLQKTMETFKSEVIE